MSLVSIIFKVVTSLFLKIQGYMGQLFSSENVGMTCKTKSEPLGQPGQQKSRKFSHPYFSVVTTLFIKIQDQQ